MLRTDELDYELPERLIARRPVQPRHDARLLVVSRSDAQLLEHARVLDLPSFLEPSDLIVRNVSRVVPARLEGRRADTHGRVRGLYLETVEGTGQIMWRVLLRSNGRLRPEMQIELPASNDGETGITLRLLERHGAGWLVAASSADDAQGDLSSEAMLRRVGATPLPPYILGARERDGDNTTDDADRDWYQTVYASLNAGSVAAPTAGLHFSEELLAKLTSAGVEMCDLILHVGEGTFRPVESERLDDHPMHSERFEVGADTINAIQRARAEVRRVFAIGTTTARALESLSHRVDSGAETKSVSGETDILIAPGHQWQWIDGMMTNFHLPRSTLLAMIAALFPEGVDRVKQIYTEAIREEYRFYSYGDAMLILP